jgi:hypothetical protein
MAQISHPEFSGHDLFNSALKARMQALANVLIEG